MRRGGRGGRGRRLPVVVRLLGPADDEITGGQSQARGPAVALQGAQEHGGAGQARGEVGGGSGQHAGGRSGLHDAPVLEHDDVVGQGGHVQDVVRDQQDGQPLLGGAPADDGAHLGAGRHVQGGHGLVEDEGARARGQGAGQSHPGGLAPRQLSAGAPGQVRGAHGREFGQGAPAGLRAGVAPAARPEGDIVQDAHVREDPRSLGQQGDVAPPGRHEDAGAVQDALAQAHPAGLGVEQSGGHGAGGGLARAVGAHERQGAAGLDGQIDDDVAGGGGKGDAQGDGAVGPRGPAAPGRGGRLVGCRVAG